MQQSLKFVFYDLVGFSTVFVEFLRLGSRERSSSSFSLREIHPKILTGPVSVVPSVYRIVSIYTKFCSHAVIEYPEYTQVEAGGYVAKKLTAVID